MTSQQTIRLGEALSVSHGCAFKGEHFREHGDLIVMTPGNFREEGGFKDKDGKEKYYDGPLDPRFLLSKSQVVVAMTEQSKGLLGSSATIPCDNVYLHNQRIGLIHIEDPGRLDLRFVYHLLNGPSARRQIQATATGSKVRHTAPERIEALEVAIPDIAQQRKVGVVLDALEILVENNLRRIEILEALARLLYREWFVDFRFPGYEDIEFANSDLGPIPESWAITILGHEVTLMRRNIKPQEYADEEFDHYSIPALDSGRRPSIDAGTAIRSGKYLLKGQSVLVSKLNPRIPRIWRTDATMGQRRAVASTEFLVLTEPARWPLAFIYGLVSSAEFMNSLASTAGGTSTSHQRVKPADVMATAVLAPPLELVEKYAAAAEPILSLVDILLQQVEVVREARGLLLPRLVSGELDISDLDLELEAVGT